MSRSRFKRGGGQGRACVWTTAGLVLLGAALLGCNGSKTEHTGLVVQVKNGGLNVGSDIDEVIASVDGGKPLAFALPSVSFPIQFGVVPHASSSEIVTINVVGRRKGIEKVSTSAKVGFVPNQLHLLVLTLFPVCLDKTPACPTNTRCVPDTVTPAKPACASNMEDVGKLPTFTPPATGSGGAGGSGGRSGSGGTDGAVDLPADSGSGGQGTDGGDDGAPDLVIVLADNGQPCGKGADCKSTFCVDSVCCTKSNDQCAGCYACNLGGKGECTPVASGQDPHATCPAGGSFCNGNGSCTALPPSCSDGTKNGGETDTDCGGRDCSKCAAGLKCATGADCQSSVCSVGLVCVGTTCDNGIKDGTETDTDCGGNCSRKCGLGAGCVVAADCTSAACNVTTKKCVATHCEDGVKDGGETGVDCGGTCATKCEQGDPCNANADCVSQVCSKAKICVVSRCADGFQNGDEVDVDCGGSICTARCGAGSNCLGNGDCASGACSTAGKCVGSACFNGRKDSDETDIDCGGVCAAKCAQGKHCNSGGDCSNGRACVNGVCCGTASCPACQRCDLNGSGTCSGVATGTTDPGCSGACTTGACGSNGACAPAPSNTVCGPYTCSNGPEKVGQWTKSAYRNKVCDGNGTGGGACKDNPAPLDCGNNVCADGTTCRTSCTNHSDCISGFHCDQNTCVTGKAVGSDCMKGIECLSKVCDYDFDLSKNVCAYCHSANSCTLGKTCESPGGSGPRQCLSCTIAGCLPDGTADCRTTMICPARAPDCTGDGHCACGSNTQGCEVGMFCISGTCKVGALQPCVRSDDCAYGTCGADGTCPPSPSGGLCTGDYSFAECEGANSCGGLCH